MKLGRIKPSAAHLKRALPLSQYLRVPLPPAPPAIDHSQGVPYGLFRNDQIGDCTIAALANFYLTAAHLDGRQLSFTDDEIAAFYFALSGGDDTGLVEIDVLTRAQQSGFPLSGAHKLAAWVRIDQGDMESLRSCASLFRAIYVGAQLPVRAQQQQLWDATGNLTDDDAPGSWGGHAMLIPTYDAIGVRFVTWGGLKLATWSWVRTYVDEAYALLDAERALAAGVAWSDLQSDLAALNAGF